MPPEAEDHPHRERLIAAMAASIRERGFRGTTVADVVAGARTSRRSFYEHFGDREECFLALFDATNDVLLAQITDAVHPEDPWERQVDRALDAYIDTVRAEPALVQSYVRELPALGERGAARVSGVLARFARMLMGLVEAASRTQEPDAQPISFDRALFLVHGLQGLVRTAIEQGRDVDELRPVAREVVKAVLATLLTPGPPLTADPARRAGSTA